MNGGIIKCSAYPLGSDHLLGRTLAVWERDVFGKPAVDEFPPPLLLGRYAFVDNLKIYGSDLKINFKRGGWVVSKVAEHLRERINADQN